MGMANDHLADEPTRADIDATRGPLLLEFGAPWCGHCQAAQPLIAQAMDAHPGLRHLKVEDGPGQPLGRSFRIKLWPSLVFLRDGVELSRLVRPTDRQAIAEALSQLAAHGNDGA